MAQRKRTDSYWIKRANQRLTRSERISKAHMRELAKVYNEARRQTVESLKQIYAAYYKGQDGFDMQTLRSIVPSGELKRFLDDMKKLGISTDLPDNYNARITRLRFINEQLAAQAHKVAMSERTIDSKALREVYTDSYYRAGYDVARGIGSTPSGFSTLDQRTVDKVMNARFEGRNFSTRVWKNSDILAGKLKGELATAIATGQSIQKTAARFRDDFNVNQYYAERLIRTETNHFHNSAELEAYKEMGFEKFKFLATLDSRTSEICQEMDGKIFNVKDGLPGENIPPLHPNCRSTIVPYFKEYESETRLYRDPATGKNKYTYNVSYADWAESIGLPSYKNPIPKLYFDKAMPGDVVEKQLGIKRGEPMTMADALKGANPNYSKGKQWRQNCQRCVIAYELRRRGYNVAAMPKLIGDKMRNGSYFFEGGESLWTRGLNLKQLESQLMKNEPGARFIISVKWPRKRVGHTFIAERTKLGIVYLDPQPMKAGVKSYFKKARPNEISYFRCDNAKIDSKINVKAVVSNAE